MGHTTEQEQNAVQDLSGKLMKIGFYTGLGSIFLFEIGIIPLIGLIISLIGVCKFSKTSNGKVWMGISGIILNFIYFICNAYINGQI